MVLFVYIIQYVQGYCNAIIEKIFRQLLFGVGDISKGMRRYEGLNGIQFPDAELLAWSVESYAAYRYGIATFTVTGQKHVAPLLPAGAPESSLPALTPYFEAQTVEKLPVFRRFP